MRNIADFNTNYFYALREHITRGLQERLQREIMDNLLEDFKKKAEPIVKRSVEQAVVETIRRMQNLSSFKTEFDIYCTWSDENKRKKIS